MARRMSGVCRQMIQLTVLVVSDIERFSQALTAIQTSSVPLNLNGFTQKDQTGYYSGYRTNQKTDTVGVRYCQ